MRYLQPFFAISGGFSEIDEWDVRRITAVAHDAVVELGFKAGKAFHDHERRLQNALKSSVLAIETVNAATHVHDKQHPLGLGLVHGLEGRVAHAATFEHESFACDAIHQLGIVQLTTRLMLQPRSLLRKRLEIVQDRAQLCAFLLDASKIRLVGLPLAFAHVDLLQLGRQSLFRHSSRLGSSFSRDFVLLRLGDLVHRVALIQAIRSATTAQPCSVRATSASSPSVATDMRVVVRVVFAVFGLI